MLIHIFHFVLIASTINLRIVHFYELRENIPLCDPRTHILMKKIILIAVNGDHQVER